MNFIKLHELGNLTRAHPTDAGADCYACIDNPVRVHPGDIIKIPLGFAVAIPKNHMGLLASRSGHAKHGVTLANSIGVIDANYRGEVVAMFTNTNTHAYDITPGEKIAQLVVVPIWITQPIEVTSLDLTDRGTKGFGSTGK